MLRRASVLAILTSAAALMGAFAPAGTQEHGETLVRRHCAGCHAVGRSGESPEPAAPPLRELHQRYDPEMLAEALAEGLLTGHPLMPEFRFPPEEVRAIIDYLQSIQTRRGS